MCPIYLVKDNFVVKQHHWSICRYANFNISDKSALQRKITETEDLYNEGNTALLADLLSVTKQLIKDMRKCCTQLKNEKKLEGVKVSCNLYSLLIALKVKELQWVPKLILKLETLDEFINEVIDKHDLNMQICEQVIEQSKQTLQSSNVAPHEQWEQQQTHYQNSIDDVDSRILVRCTSTVFDFGRKKITMMSWTLCLMTFTQKTMYNNSLQSLLQNQTPSGNFQPLLLMETNRQE